MESKMPLAKDHSLDVIQPLIALLFLLLAAGLLWPSAAAASAGITTGVYIPGAAQETELLDRYEAQVGQRAAIVHWYQPWGVESARGAWYQPELDTRALQEIAGRGSTPMITWEAWGTLNGADPSRVRTIPTGVFDDYIDSWANGLRDFEQLVYLRLFHELNNPSYPWAYGNNGNTAEDLIAAWRYVHDRFVAAGATNVEWVWSPTTVNNVTSFSALYPGDAYVDWLGVDGYNGGNVYLDWWDGWASPAEVFDDSLERLIAINPTKPIMIVETSSVEQGGSKAHWIEELYVDLPQRFPHVRAILWFNAPWGEDERANWLIDSSRASLDAYRAALKATAPRTPTDITLGDRVAFGALIVADGRDQLRDLLSPF
jgi:hypothetical protein